MLYMLRTEHENKSKDNSTIDDLDLFSFAFL